MGKQSRQGVGSGLTGGSVGGCLVGKQPGQQAKRPRLRGEVRQRAISRRLAPIGRQESTLLRVNQQAGRLATTQHLHGMLLPDDCDYRLRAQRGCLRGQASDLVAGVQQTLLRFGVGQEHVAVVQLWRQSFAQAQ